MSIQALSDYTVNARYASYNPTLKRRETWDEMVERVFDMHEGRFAKQLGENEKFRSLFLRAKEAVRKQSVLGSQRALQFGGAPILKHEAKIFNCSFSLCDRDSFFGETMYLLLCGCGVGFSVQKQHVAKLPKMWLKASSPVASTHIIEDSIEGWADAISICINSFFKKSDTFSEFNGRMVHFDYSNIRPEGALIAGQFKAPGPKGLKAAIEKIQKLILSRIISGEDTLRPIDAYDIIMHASDAVLSGGVRRSATIAMFSKDDMEMMTAKTGKWYEENPQRGRSNNSVALDKNTVTEEEFKAVSASVKQFGEPGFIFLSNLDSGFNPCVEINLYPIAPSGKTGFAFCNLCEINGRLCTSEEAFLEACVCAAVVGTMQADYTKFKYLSSASQEATEREALLGISLTGWMDNPKTLFNADTLKRGAEIVKETNEFVANVLGIRPASRLTCVKPAGSTSCVFGTASGIHPHHANRYIRNAQVNKQEFPGQYYKFVNPTAVEESVWSANKTDNVISFLCEVPKGAIVKNNLRAIELLEKVKFVQQHWVQNGTREELNATKGLVHNVSNTISVEDDEWDEVFDFIFANKDSFAGVSLLPADGDLDYPQAPFQTILNEKEIVAEYGSGAILASGLIVDGLSAFDDNLWKACSEVLSGDTQSDIVEPVEPRKPKRSDFKSEKLFFSALNDYTINLNLYYQEQQLYRAEFLRRDWVRRAKQFAVRYFESNTRKMTYCLKHTLLWKKWMDIKREHKDIDWSTVQEDTQQFVDASSLAGQACAGGKCSSI